MTPKNVLIISAYPPGLHQYGIEKALRELGRQVCTAGRTSGMLLDLEQALQRHDPGYAYNLIVPPDVTLAEILARCPFSPDVILYLESATPCLPVGLAEAPCPVVALLTEDLLNADLYDAMFPYFDLALCTWKSTEKNWRHQGHDNVTQWYYGARPSFCVDEHLERVWDVAFLGNLNPRVQRRRLPMVGKLLRLRDEGRRVYVGGNLFFEAYNRIHCQAKIVYHQGITDQVNMRVFEAMGAGCLVVMRRPRDPDDPTTSFFRDREEVVFCDTDDEALALIRYYLEHEDERRRIAAAGHRAVLSRHNYVDVVRQLVQEILPRLPQDFLAARRRRLDRAGKSDTRRRLDYARFYLGFGALEACQGQVHALASYATQPEARHLLGLLFAAAGQPDVAVQHLQLACALGPDALLPRANLAVVALLSNHPDSDRWSREALAALEQAGTKVPSSALEGPYFPFDYDRFRLEVSQTYFRHPAGPARNADLGRLYRWRLHVLMGRRDLEHQRAIEALAHFERALELVPDDGYVVYDRARAASTLGDPRATVLADLRRAVQLEPFFGEAQCDLALALEQLGVFEEAFVHYWDLVRHNPLARVPAQLWQRVGELALKLGKKSEAMLAFEEAARLAPDDAELHDRLTELKRPPLRASIILAVGDEPRLAQRALASLQEHSADSELLIVKRGSGRALEAFLRLLTASATVIPGGPSLVDDYARAAERATGSHLVFLDPRLTVQSGWLQPLLEAAAEGGAASVPQVVDDSTGAPTSRSDRRMSVCLARQLWSELGGFRVPTDLAAALGDVLDRLTAQGGTVREVPASVVLAAAEPVPASVPEEPATPITPVVPTTAPISRGLKHVPRPPSQYFDFARPEVAALVPPEARRILDVGCGGGALGALLKQRPGVEVYGIESDPEAVTVARQRLDQVLTLDLDALEALPVPPGFFDCIICADVLEHLMDPERTLTALLRHLGAGGSLIASIPNVRHQDVLLDLLVRGRWQYQPSGILDATHLRFYTAEEIAALVNRLGLKVEQSHANASEAAPGLEAVAAAVAQLGGDAQRFLNESRIIQYVFRARRAVLQAPAAPPAARPEPAARGKASVVVLAWNELEYTQECVKSVLANTSPPYELILVDNGSADGTLEFFRSVAGAKVVANGANLGFAGGNNRGMLAATGDYVVLLNNDTLVTEGWLDGLIACADEDPAIGIVGPMSNYVSGPQLVPQVSYQDYPALLAWAREFGQRHRGRRLELNRIVGFCMLLKRDVIARVGLLDERFGLGNFEDDDYCLRAGQAGFRLVVAADVFVHHFGSRTFLGQGVDFEAAMRHGQEVFTQKWQGKLAPAGKTTR